MPGADANTDLDDRRGSRGRRARGEDARQARRRPCALERVGQAGVRHGCEVIYHASYTDERGARHAGGADRDKIFVAPGLSVIEQAAVPRRHRRHLAREGASRWATRRSSAAAEQSLKAMHKRGIRVLPGGDYGFAWAPHGDNAMDLQYFVKYVGMTPMEAHRLGDQARRRDHDARRRAGAGEGGRARRPAAGRRRPARQPRDPARPDQAPRDHEGRRVPQGADRRRARRLRALGRPEAGHGALLDMVLDRR